MKKSFLSQLNRAVKSIALTAASAMLLGGCGGGGGGGQESQVTPASLDGVTVRLFNAFTIQLQKRSSGTNTESGVAIYKKLQDNFFVGDGGVGATILLPNDGALRDMEYTLNRISSNTGTLILRSKNTQSFPFSEANKDNPNKRGFCMFWPERGSQHELVLDVLFTESSGKINPRLTALVKNYLDFISTWISDTEGAVSNIYPVSFNTKDAEFTLTSGGGPLPSGYTGIVYSKDQPYLGIWTGLSNPKKNLEFKTTSKSGAARAITRFIRHDTTTVIPSVSIDGLTREKISDSGVVGYDVISDLPNESVSNQKGAYSYANTGGSAARLSIQERGEIIHYTLEFTSNIGGRFKATNGEVGTFTERLITNSLPN